MPAVDLAALRAHLERRGAPLEPAAARFLGRALASALADAHATLDAEGNPAPVVRGALGVRIDTDGQVTLDPGPGSEGAAPEVLAGGRITPRADVYAMGTLLRPLLAVPEDPELLAALATATEPLVARRRITCVELEAWLARGADLDAGRRSLAETVQTCLEPAPETEAELPLSSRPLPAPARVGVALVTAAAVFAAGVAVAEGWVLR